MTPVVILAIDSRTPTFYLSPSLSTLPHLSCFELFLVVYVTTVVARAGLLITPEGAQSHKDLAHIIDITQVGNLVLSLLTNVFATSIIATKSWYVRGILQVGSMFYTLIDTPTC
jgi:hypothetical protein